ncbi:hypothetical protein GCM10009603_54380 [Nocardiopsis exhalans]
MHPGRWAMPRGEMRMVPFGKGTLFEVDAAPEPEAPRSSRTSEHAQPPPMGSSQKSQRSMHPIMPCAYDKREGTPTP